MGVGVVLEVVAVVVVVDVLVIVVEGVAVVVIDVMVVVVAVVVVAVAVVAVVCSTQRPSKHHSRPPLCLLFCWKPVQSKGAHRKPQGLGEESLSRKIPRNPLE